MQSYRLQLLAKLVQYFSESELRGLCFGLGVDYDDLPGQGKNDKAREMISYFERRGRLQELLDRCARERPNVSWNQTTEAIPASRLARLLPSITTQAVAYYMLGLAHHMLGNLSEARRSYLKTIDAFGTTQSYMQQEDDRDGAAMLDTVLEWVKKLRIYVSKIRLRPPSDSKLICPWQHGEKGKYLLAELSLIEPFNIGRIGKSTGTATFLEQREQVWLQVGDEQIDGYRIPIERDMRVLYFDDSFRSIIFPRWNPLARLNTHLILPAGATYYAFNINGLQTPSNLFRSNEDCFLVWSQVTPVPESPVFFQYSVGNNQTVTFRRDSDGRVRITQVSSPPPPRIIGGNVDFTMHLLPLPSLPSQTHMHILG